MKTRPIAFGLLILVLAVLLPAHASAQKTYSAERYDVNLTVHPDGSLSVAETVVFNFDGGPFTFVFRELPTRYTDGITGITATMDGTLFPPGENAGQVEIRGRNTIRRNTIRVEWHFAPTSDSTHTFVLNYRALGVVQQTQNADVLAWQALPNEHDYSIASSTVRVNWAKTPARWLNTQVSRGTATSENGERETIFTASNLAPDAPLQVNLEFAPGSLISVPPAWQSQQARSDAIAPLWITLATILFGVGSFILILMGLRQRRDSSVVGTSPRVTRPPSTLPPALAGALNGRGPSWSNAVGALFHLGQRGIIRIDETVGRGWFRSRDFEITRVSELTDSPSLLRPHEQGLLALLFADKKGTRSQVTLSELGNRASARWKEFAEPLKREMSAAGFYDPARQQLKHKLNLFATLFLLLGVAILVAALLLISPLGGWVVLIPLAIMGNAFVAYMVAATISPLSEQGAREAARWQGFYQYLRALTRGQEPLDAYSFEDYLPYAASYGMAEAWAKKYKQAFNVALPAWFHALSTSGAGDESMAAFAVLMTASSSSGDGGAAAAGAGAAAAGGGASGAG